MRLVTEYEQISPDILNLPTIPNIGCRMPGRSPSKTPLLFGK